VTRHLSGALDRFEALMTTLIEGPFKRWGHARLQPVELARSLALAMERAGRPGLEGRTAPNRYRVALHPQDWAGLAEFRGGLEIELARYAQQAAEERGLLLCGPPHVDIVADEAVAERGVRVTAEFVPGVARSPGPERASAWRLEAPPPAQPRPLVPPRVSLGRALDNDIVLDDPRVSRYHAELRTGVDGWSVYDLGSTNGTYVNGARVTACALRASDRLSLGDHEFVLAGSGSPD
jgi:hypothetical protein